MIPRSELSRLIGHPPSLFAGLNEAQLQRIAALMRPQQYGKDTLIFSQGDPGDRLYFVVSGRVRIFLSGPDGREATIRIYGDHSTFGEFSVLDAQPRSASATALTDLVLLELLRDDFQAMLREDFDLVLRVIAQLTERVRYTTNYAEQLAFLSASGRIAAVLIAMAAAEGKPAPVRIVITQQELAFFTNVTREVVNKVLNEFAQQGLVRLGRGAVVVHDSTGLERLTADN